MKPQLGTATFRRHHHGDEMAIEVLSADPHILISDEFLSDIEENPSELAWIEGIQPAPPPQTSCGQQAILHAMQTRDPIDAELALLTIRHEAATSPRQHDHPFEGTLLHINACNGKLVYRIGQYRLRENAWEASWPD